MPTLQPLIVPGELHVLKAVRDYVTAAAEQAGLDRLMINRLRLAVDEIVTNIIVYGYGESGIEGDVRIWADIDDQQLVITVEDSGPYFDPTQHDLPDPDELGQALETREIGGLGIYLAATGIDGFHYERVGQYNRNIFVALRDAD